MGLFFHSKGQINDSNTDLYEFIYLFPVNHRDVFFIKTKMNFYSSQNTGGVYKRFTHTMKIKG